MKSVKILLCIVFTVCTTVLAAQTIDALREEIEKAKKEIQVTNELLSKTVKNKNATQSQLKLIQSRITSRKKIVANLEQQTRVISADIGSKNQAVGQLQTRLEKLKAEYATMVYSAYKNYKLNSFMLFLFASKDFNDATRRVAYMRRYNQMRERKVAQIDSVACEVGTQIDQLKQKSQELVKVKDTQASEIKKLGKDESEYKTSVTALQKEQSKLTSVIRARQKQIDNAQAQIKRIIAEESRKNGAKPQSAAEREYVANLSDKFDQNMGKLPYPVRSGVIVDGYGRHSHPTQKGIIVDNKGVNIASAAGAAVSSVFEGEVVRVFFFQGLNNSVMIRHGNYITVYSNLQSVDVKAGDKVKLNQVIGRLSSSDNEEDHVLHFEIWKETQNLNPQNWLRR